MYVLKNSLSVSLLLACIWTVPASAADITAGEQKAANCLGCHGPKGKSSNAQWPNLAAQQSTYTVNQLNAFKTGTRNNPMMQSMAANLSDEDINNLAAYYFSQPPVYAGGDPNLAKSGKNQAGMWLGRSWITAERYGPIPRLCGQHPELFGKQFSNF